jgi:translation elongation factor EF-Ts
MKNIKVSVDVNTFQKLLNKNEWKEEGDMLTQVITENDQKYSYYKMLFGSTGVVYSYENLDDKKAEKPKKKEKKAVIKKEAHQVIKKEGFVGSYVHGNGRIGVLVKIYTITDFAARTEELKAFAKDVAMQIAAMGDEALLEQEFIKDPTIKMQVLLDKIRKDLGEKVEIGTTIRFEL